MVRSKIAHGILKGVDTKVASAMPGVLAILTYADIAAAGFGPMKCGLNIPQRDGSPMKTPPRHSLAKDRVRYVGEAVACVVAETAVQAKDAAEAVELDIEELPAVTTPAQALTAGAPQLHDEAPGNLALDFHYGDAEAVKKAFAEAAHVTRLDINSNRIVVNPMESRSAIGAFEDGRWVLRVGCQGVMGLRGGLAKDVLNTTPDKVRVLTGNVGGSFGMKSQVYPEYGPLLLAARTLGRPVKWTDERSERFLSDHHGRAHQRIAQLARDQDGRFLAARLTGTGQYLEVTGPPSKEYGGIRFEQDGSITMLSGTLDYGQGHATPFAQVLGGKLGIPVTRFRLLQGDSDQLKVGGGTGGSKSALVASQAFLEAGDKLIGQGKQIAAHVLEAAVTDIEFAHGRFTIAGTDRGIGVLELAEKLRKGLGLPSDIPQSLDVSHISDNPPFSFPNGCHVAEVEIDRDTGVVEVVHYSMVNDFGTVINPMLTAGQAHGGVVQGIGQALMERTVYDPQGQPVAGSYMDYALPRASDTPAFSVENHSVPCKTNLLGVKGCGEAGCAGALPSVMNAVVDALSEVGVTHIDMPATPEKVWRVLNGA